MRALTPRKSGAGCHPAEVGILPKLYSPLLQWVCPDDQSLGIVKSASIRVAGRDANVLGESALDPDSESKE